MDNCTKHLRIDDRDALAYARRGLTLLVLGRDAEAAPDLARYRELVPEMQPHLQRVIDLVRRSQNRSVPRVSAGQALALRLIDGVFSQEAQADVL
jgi:hypothetical protein